MFDFAKVEAVKFKDFNQDGTLNILVFTSYFESRPDQGKGIGGKSIFVRYVFISKNEIYEINND